MKRFKFYYFSFQQTFKYRNMASSKTLTSGPGVTEEHIKNGAPNDT